MPTVGLDADGDYAVAWVSDYQDGSFAGVYAQRFDQGVADDAGPIVSGLVVADDELPPGSPNPPSPTGTQ